MHWGTVIGSEADAQQFAAEARAKADTEVVILERVG
jgi:hypothetical protein